MRHPTFVVGGMAPSVSKMETSTSVSALLPRSASSSTLSSPRGKGGGSVASSPQSSTPASSQCAVAGATRLSCQQNCFTTCICGQEKHCPICWRGEVYECAFPSKASEDHLVIDVKASMCRGCQGWWKNCSKTTPIKQLRWGAKKTDKQPRNFQSVLSFEKPTTERKATRPRIKKRKFSCQST